MRGRKSEERRENVAQIGEVSFSPKERDLWGKKKRGGRRLVYSRVHAIAPIESGVGRGWQKRHKHNVRETGVART